MATLTELSRRLFGEIQPEKVLITRTVGKTTYVRVKPLYPRWAMVLRYPPGAEICLDDKDSTYRPLDGEDVLAREVYYGDGASHGLTLGGKFFKTLGAPSEVTALHNITPQNSALPHLLTALFHLGRE